MSLPSFKLLRPQSIEEAVGYLAKHAGAIQILAGGTDLIPSMKQRLFSPAYVMDIRGIEEIQGIHVVLGVGVEIGALTPLSAIEDSEFIRRNYRVLHEAASTVAAVPTVTIVHNLQYHAIVWFHNRNRYAGSGSHGRIPAAVSRSLLSYAAIGLLFSLTFSAAARNLFNNVNYGNPGSTYGVPLAASFGRITSAGSMRQMQLGGKLLF